METNLLGRRGSKLSFCLLAAILAYLILVSLIFWFDPGLDLLVSSLFWKAGSGFIYLHMAWAIWARHILNFLVWLCVGLSFLGLIFLNKKYKTYKKYCLYLLLCFALAPGLLVNTVLKNHWGQPRPIEIQLFGGHMTYQKDWVISKQCPTNCSFVCGDCSAAFILMAFVPLVFSRRKKILLASLIITGSVFIGLIRLGQGGHFLSDVLLAYGLDGLVIFLVYQWILCRGGPKCPPKF